MLSKLSGRMRKIATVDELADFRTALWKARSSRDAAVARATTRRSRNCNSAKRGASSFRDSRQLPPSTQEGSPPLRLGISRLLEICESAQRSFSRAIVPRATPALPQDHAG